MYLQFNIIIYFYNIILSYFKNQFIIIFSLFFKSFIYNLYYINYNIINLKYHNPCLTIISNI